MTSPLEPDRVGILAHGLTKAFEDPVRGTILGADGVSFECRYGEVFGLLGPNGAGKTTTLRLLATLMRPSAGRAIVHGFDVLERPQEVRGAIGYLSASTGLYARLTPRELMVYIGRLHGLDARAADRRAEQMIDEFGMREFSETRCERLSTGMRQKVSIARTLVHDPPVLILDEPTTGLDVLVQSATVRFIRGCRDRGKCILLSTHILAEAEKLCDRLAIIHRGRILALGSQQELRAQTGACDLEGVFMSVVADH
jgi:sodium transport system ATP-binding protein